MTQIDLFGKKPEVIIDVHEIKGKRNSKNSIIRFRNWLKQNNTLFQVKKLEVGDLILSKGYAIERKTVADFCHSLFGSKAGKPRLMNQVKALKEAYEHPILFLEGGLTIRKDPNTNSIFYLKHRKKHQHKDYLYWSLERKINMHPNQLEGAIQKIREMGLKVMKTFNDNDGVEKLKELFLNIQEGKDGENTANEEKRPPKIRQKPKLQTLLDKQIFLLSGLPQISTVRAKKLLREFSNPLKAIRNIDEWKKIKGIGEKTVEKNKKVLYRQEIEEISSKTKSSCAEN